jgi:drug/metabolite transporter (DMT)-like permease
MANGRDKLGDWQAALTYGVAATALCLWGGTAIANKMAVMTIDPLAVGILRTLIAELLAAPIAAALRLPMPRRGRELALLLVSGLSSFAIWPILLSLGLGLTSAAHAGLIIALIPVFTGLITGTVDRQWPRLTWWLGGAAAIAGAGFLVLYRDGGAIRGASAAGDLTILAGVIACATGYVAGGRLSPVIGTWLTTFWGLAATSVVLLPIMAFLADRTDWSAVEPSGWLALGYLALLSTLGGYLAWFWALGRGGIARISSWQLAQPVVTLGPAALVLGERLTLALLASAAIIVAGTASAQRPRRGSAHRTARPVAAE